MSCLFCKQQRSARFTFCHPVHRVKTFYISLTSAKLFWLTLHFWYTWCSARITCSVSSPSTANWHRPFLLSPAFSPSLFRQKISPTIPLCRVLFHHKIPPTIPLWWHLFHHKSSEPLSVLVCCPGWSHETRLKFNQILFPTPPRWSEDMEFVKCFARASFPIFKNLPEKNA